MKPIYFEKSLGIDIRDETVAVTLLAKGLRSIDVVGSHFFNIPALGEGEEKAEKEFLDTINRFLIKMDIWPDNVVVSLPRNRFSFQTFELPAPDRKSVNAMVLFELEHHLSSGLEGLYYAFHASRKAENQFHIVSAAVKKEIADYYLDLIQRLGLLPTMVGVSTLANANLVLAGSKQKETLWTIVDLGSREIDIAILQNRRVEFSRNVPLDDPDYRATYFRRDLSQAHYESLASGLSKIIVEQLQDALSSCRAIGDSDSIEQIHLMGAGPFAPYLAKQLEQDTEVPTTRAQVPDNVNLALSKSFSTAFMATSFGLAMEGLKTQEIEVNLLPAELAPRKKTANLKTTLALAAATVVLAIGMLINGVVYKKVTLANLDKQLEEIKSETGTLEQIDLEYNNLKQEIGRLNNINRTYPLKIPVLVELSRVLPPDAWLTNIKISKNKMEVRGYSSAASKLVPLLEQSPHFKETSFVGSITKERGKERFTIRTEIE